MALTPRQHQFVAEYLLDLNATQAAIRAGYSRRTAAVIGHEHLRKPKIRAAIQRHADEHLGKLDISADHVLGELARLAFANMSDYIAVEDGELRFDFSRINRDQAAAICSLDSDGERIKLRLADKRAALELLGRYLKLFVDRSEHDLTPKLGTDLFALLSQLAKREQPRLNAPSLRPANRWRGCGQIYVPANHPRLSDALNRIFFLKRAHD